MILKRLVEKADFEEVWKSLVKHYPDSDRESYEYTWGILGDLAPTENPELWSLDITHVVDDFKNTPQYPKFVEKFPEFKDDEWPIEEWEDVHGLKPGDDQPYAMELHTFADWLGWNITQRTLDNYSEVDIVAHCLYEMTFFGYCNDQITKKREEIHRSYEECMRNNENLKPWRPDEEV